MANNFNLFEETPFSVGAELGRRQITNRERLMMEALLEDRGIFAGAVAAPTPSPSPAPAPTPSPTPAAAATPTPTPARAETSERVLSAAIVRLALTTVKPGDLITADFINTLVEGLFELDQRVRKLEDGYYGKELPGGSATLVPTPTPTVTPSRSKPIIDSVDVFTISGRGTAVTVAGKNIGEGLVERVLLGTKEIPLSSVKFSGTGFNFLTTAAIVGKAQSRITVVTSSGEDSAALPAKATPAPTATVRAEK